MTPSERLHGREAAGAGPVPKQSVRARSELSADTGVSAEPGTQSLVQADNFIQATRDAGYANAAAAVAELIDNSIQAGASVVEVSLRRPLHVGSGESLEIAVSDNGCGMSAGELANALRFGGSSRFGRRDGIGRFGMGLPNASISQARCVNVYSWMTRGGCLRAVLDVDQIAMKAVGGVAGPTAEVPPPWVPIPDSAHGTAVVWERCDRVPYRRPGMLVRHLVRELGRVFRRPIAAGFTIRVNGTAVQRIDPTRLIPSPPGLPSAVTLPPLRFAFDVGGGRTSTVEVVFSSLPVEEWTGLHVQAKREYGISKGAGVSVMRAGREIARGWFFMGTKRRENYDDWWRCEVSFSPELDEFFGVSHTKQGIRPTPELLCVLTPTVEAEARRLNREVRERFTKLRLTLQQATTHAHDMHHRLPSFEPQHTESVASFAASPSYELRSRAGRGHCFIDATTAEGRLTVTLNEHHPFFRHLYAPAQSGDRRALARAMDLWLLALGRALVDVEGAAVGRSTDLLRRWSDAGALLLEER